MDIRSEFWSAVEKSKNKKEVKPKSSIKKFSFNNEPAYYLDIKTNENLTNDIDAQILYQMTKTNSVNESYQSQTQTFEDAEMMRRKWRLQNNMRESTAFTQNTPSSSSSSSAGRRPDFNNYVDDGYISDYFE